MAPKIFSKLTQSWLQNSALVLVIVATVAVSSIAAIKLADNIANPIKSPISSLIASPTTTVTIPTTQTDNIGLSDIPAKSFNTVELAKHNKNKDCYVAFKGVVYDVSAHSQWRNCWHFGINGGQDITNIFPHPTSYLSKLPIVGRFTDPSPTKVNISDESERNDD